jgi:anti-sigma B factor antagonist
MSSEVRFKEEHQDDFVKVYISGEIDIYTSQKFKEKLYSMVDSFKKDLKVDCTDLNYIDSTGLGIFVGALKRARYYDKRIFVINPKANIKKLFTITGLDKLFIIE